MMYVIAKEYRSQLSDVSCVFFFFKDIATTDIYTLSLHDALPICVAGGEVGLHLRGGGRAVRAVDPPVRAPVEAARLRSEEHTSELQSRLHLVCRLLLEKKNNADEV